MPIEDTIDDAVLQEYKNSITRELSTQRHTLHKKISTFSTLYPKMTTSDFYRLCSYTHAENFSLPKSIPNNLRVAKTIYENIFYSSLVRTVLLIKEGYKNALIHEPNRPEKLFCVVKGIEDLLLTEQRLELYKYLNLLLKDITPLQKESKDTRLSLLQRVLNLEKRVNAIEKNKKR